MESNILAAYSHNWSKEKGEEFRNGISALLADVEQRIRDEYPSLNLKPYYLMTGKRPASLDDLPTSIALGILDATDYDEDMAFLAGHMQSARIPFVFLSDNELDAVKQTTGLNHARVITYKSLRDLFRQDSPLFVEVSQAISQARLVGEFVYEMWFPRETSTIWVVCPQIHEPGEYADRSSPDYTYLDNLGDTDALLEVLVFLSRYYPQAIVEKFSSGDLPRGHANNNLVVIGGPGSSSDIGNRTCQEMMSAISSKVSYSEDCEKMLVTAAGGQLTEFQAELRSASAKAGQRDDFNMRRDRGYFSRFANPLNEVATVVLVNGIHTAGVLGAAIAFADRRESLRNYETVFSSSITPKSFECHFEVDVLNGTVKVPRVSSENIFPIGLSKTVATQGERKLKLQEAEAPGRTSVKIIFVAGDRGGVQRNQIQIPREFDSILTALRSSEHRDSISIATPILAATYEKLIEAYRQRPGILHFAGHGDDRSLSFISDQGLIVSEIPLITERLVSILKSFPERVRLCVLNTCDSEDIAKELVTKHATDAAIGWPGQLTDSDAIQFSGTFYGRLGDGLSLVKSVELAIQSLVSGKRPILVVDKDVDQNAGYV